MSTKQSNPSARKLTPGIKRLAGYVAVVSVPLGALGCSSEEAPATHVAETQQALEAPDCGYAVSAEIRKVTRKDFRARVKVTKIDGSHIDAAAFNVLVNAGTATLVKVGHGTFQASENGYLLNTVSSDETEEDSEGDEDSPPDADVIAGRAYRFHLKFEGSYTQLKANIISSDGVACDRTAPTLKLSTSSELVTSNASLTLNAEATDDVAVAKVVFFRDGVTIGTDTTAPYSLNVPITSALNGRRQFTATAYDLTGNQGSETKRVLVAIGNKFFGTAPATAADYTGLLYNFNQITPANAGKWGSVEATRDQMNWADLDTAYHFAKTNNLPFKFHALVWGQQQPPWLAALPAGEQLAELEQWMAAVAARYPALDLIDVVNEPLHAPPSYAAALGGTGTTGWDWVVNAFEMARVHFPTSELLLNDYSVLSMASATTDYLNIVKALKDRGLIDGISEQAHFYERAPDLSLLTTNLNAFTATGLPIYISELDLNFADDARQANRMKDLFSLFWSNPSVLGITHWGHLQGNTWQANAYLIRSNGTARPALTWIQCYRAGGSNCPVPVYVAQPRTGDSTSINLEAEEYDAAQGLLPAGNVVAYAADGSWLRFDRVVFNSAWSKLNVSYANGATAAVNLSIHLDSLASPAVATVPLVPTGSWGTLQTASVSWTPIAAERNVYVRFNGGGANVDKLQFSAATTTTNLVTNGAFEAGTSGWYTFNGGTLSASAARAHGGSQSLLVTNRTNNAPAAIDLTSAVRPGNTYPMSLWVSLNSPDGSSQSINVTQATSCRAANGTVSTSYNWIAGPATVAGGSTWSWVQLAGSVAVPANCTLTQLQLFVEGGAGSELYVDDVQVLEVTGASTNLLSDGSFESGQGAWGGWGYTTLGVVSSAAHSGAQSLRGAGMTNGAIARDIRALVAAGKRYQATVWVAVGNLTSAPVRLQTIQSCNATATDSYPWLAGDTVNNGAWKQLVGTVDLSACTSIEKLQLFVGADAGDLYLDDVTLTPLP
jgi:GH35 family endo-1,4-beta-xylanase